MIKRWLDRGSPVPPTEAGLVLAYLAIALARQVARDVRTIYRWAH